VKKSSAAAAGSEDSDGGYASDVGPAMMTRVVVNYDPGTLPGQYWSK